jgi:hypothetical protein
MQVAKHEWKQSWPNYLSSSRGWIVAQIDGRGSGGEGDRRRFEIWHHLGNVEVIDQVFYQFFFNRTWLIILKYGSFPRKIIGKIWWDLDSQLLRCKTFAPRPPLAAELVKWMGKGLFL